MKKIFLISSFLIIIQFSHSQYITDRTIIYYQFNEDKSVLLHKHCPFFLRISTETNSYSIINSSWGVTLDHNADGTGSQDSVLIYQDTISIGYMSFSKDTISCIDSKSDQTMLIFKYLDKYRTKVINMGKFFKKDEILYLTTIIGEGWREVLTWKDMQGISGNIHNSGDFWKAAGIGALAGLAGFGAGSLVGGMLGTATTLGGSILNGAAVGAAGGFSGGFVGGAGNAWTNGANFGQGLKTGLISGGIGGASGAVLGGMTGGLQYRKQMAFFHKGNDVLGIDAEDAVPATDQFLGEAQKAWYPDAPMEYVDAHSFENVPKNLLDDMIKNDAWAMTDYGLDANRNFTGRSSVYYNNTRAFSAKQLFFTMGHEFVHVSQFAALKGYSVNILTSSFHNLMEFSTHSYVSNELGGGNPGMRFHRIFTNADYTTWNSILHYTSFPWTSNHNFIYPLK